MGSIWFRPLEIGLGLYIVVKLVGYIAARDYEHIAVYSVAGLCFLVGLGCGLRASRRRRKGKGPETEPMRPAV